MQEILKFHDPTKPFDWPKEEEKVLELWRELDAFQESIRQSEGRKPYSFYDGPVRLSLPVCFCGAIVHILILWLVFATTTILATITSCYVHAAFCNCMSKTMRRNRIS